MEQSDPAPQEDPAEALAAFLADWDPSTLKRPRRKRLQIIATIAAVLVALTVGNTTIYLVEKNELIA